MLTLDKPFIDWVSLAKGMGINAIKVDSCEELAKSMKLAYPFCHQRYDILVPFPW